MARFCLAAALLGAAAPQLRSQAAESGWRILPVDHWAYEYIERLHSRGLLTSLNPLVQPYRRIDVARALLSVDKEQLNNPVRDWVEALESELRSELQSLSGGSWRTFGVELSGGARAANVRRLAPTSMPYLDSLREFGSGGVWPRYRVAAWVEYGHLVVQSGLLGDLYFRDDPDGLDPGQRRGGRPDQSYVGVQFRPGGLMLGRLQRNWSWLGSRGLLISNTATSYPQLGAEIDLGRWELRFFVGELDTVADYKRYVAANRLDYATPNLAMSLSQSVLYGTRSGLQLRFLNPADFLFFEHDNAPYDLIQNLAVDLQLWFRRGSLQGFVEGLLDDIDLKPRDDGRPAAERAPLRYAFFAGVRLSPLWSRGDFNLSYEQVGAWTYRTVDPAVDRYLFLNRGLGANFSDYDRLSVWLDVYPRLPFDLRLTPVAEIVRKGEGDIRSPIPVFPSFRGEPALFVGVKETTTRGALRIWSRSNTGLWWRAEVGAVSVQDAGHKVGSDRFRWTALLEVGTPARWNFKF